MKRVMRVRADSLLPLIKREETVKNVKIIGNVVDICHKRTEFSKARLEEK